ncbi:MAG: YqaE/Pmp3 family membrane protein [Armatimonadota bacterium]
MSFGRAVLCLIFPPLAVIDRGCGTVLIVLALSLVGWVPGVLAALYINTEAARR